MQIDCGNTRQIEAAVYGVGKRPKTAPLLFGVNVPSHSEVGIGHQGEFYRRNVLNLIQDGIVAYSVPLQGIARQ